MDAEDDHSCAGSSEDLQHNLCNKKAEDDCEEPQVDDILLLTEDDIPVASLNGKSPSQLTLAPGTGDKCMHHLATCSCTKRKMYRKELEGEIL